MRKRVFKSVALVSAIFTLTTANAQEQMAGFLTTGLSDANKLVGAYASPLLKSFGTGLNGGWYNTGKPLGAGGFDFRVSFCVPIAPTSDRSFDVNSLGLSNQTRVVGSNSTAATVFGSSKASEMPEVGVYGRYPGATQDSMLTSTKLPQGLGVPYFMVPAPQLTVGIGLKTDVSVRFLPKLDLGGAKVEMLGVSIKHDIKQWVPVMKELPFDLSVQAGFTNLSGSIAVDALSAAASSNTTYNANPNKVYNQSVELTSKAYNANLILSKKMIWFTPYISVGYYAASTVLTMKGDYPITMVNENFDFTKAYGSPFYNANDPNAHPKIVKELTDPVKVTGDISSLCSTVGFRAKFTVFALHVDYTLGKYNMLTTGISIGMQSLVPPKVN